MLDSAFVALEVRVARSVSWNVGQVNVAAMMLGPAGASEFWWCGVTMPDSRQRQAAVPREGAGWDRLAASMHSMPIRGAGRFLRRTFQESI